ncbi:hypothetical protein SLE2022_095500 [Rubroshorea leprosula]
MKVSCVRKVRDKSGILLTAYLPPKFHLYLLFLVHWLGYLLWMLAIDYRYSGSYCQPPILIFNFTEFILLVNFPLHNICWPHFVSIQKPYLFPVSLTFL